MISIELTNKEVTTPGLYIMRWKGQTGLVRVVGEPVKGWTILNPANAREAYLAELPKDGLIPKDALMSDPLALSVH